VLEPFSLQYYQQYNTEWTSNRVANINTERQRALLRSSKGVTATAKDSDPRPLTAATTRLEPVHCPPPPCPPFPSFPAFSAVPPPCLPHRDTTARPCYTRDSVTHP
jgi:hypothetical protein